MCGIAGVVRFDQGPVDPAWQPALLGALAHRGPDGEGAYGDPPGRALLVHRRLAVIAPGEDGRQPMATPDGRYTIVFNGEVYNHAELRGALEARGERFLTRSDTEVLLRIVAREGPGGLAAVRGMFACAVWDGVERTLLVARDRFGIKPLYWTAWRDGVAFASEVRALVEAGLAPRRASAAGVLAFLRWAHVPAPLTWREGVHALEAGTWRQWDAEGRVRAGRFSDVRAAWVTPPREIHAGADALCARAQEALVDSVRAHLVADVPVGVFLSGGLDSAALVKACRLVQSTPVRALTIITDDAAQSEAVAAAAVARAYGAAHETVHVDAERVLRDWPLVLRHLDQPSVDGVNTFLVAHAAAAAGLKSVLSGIGGDELFGGYPSFMRLTRAAALGRRAPGLLRLAAGAVARASPPGHRERWRHVAEEGRRVGELYRAARGFLMPAEVAGLAGPALRDAPDAGAEVDRLEAGWFEPAGAERPLASVARLETCAYLRHQLLRDADATSMAHGVELRTPLVDHALLARVWPALGAHPALLHGKQILRRWLANELPASVVWGRKRTFSLPFDRWLHGSLRDLVRSGLADLAAAGWLAPAGADGIWRDWQAGRAHWSRPWALGVLGRMLRDA